MDPSALTVAQHLRVFAGHVAGFNSLGDLLYVVLYAVEIDIEVIAISGQYDVAGTRIAVLWFAYAAGVDYMAPAG
jgi:hypothetical protein